MDSLLASASALESAPESSDSPNIDDLIKEQLASKVEDVPDLTGDMDSLLASAPDLEPILEPSLAASYSLPPASGSLGSPNIDDLIKEQLTPKVENLPDLTGDMDSLLASAPDLEPTLEPSLSASYSLPPVSGSLGSSPNIDDLIKEQLASKVEDMPDLTGDMDSLLASVPDSEPELMPYVPPAPRDEVTISPTMTLAELYMDQGLPQKAAAVYKELLILDPNNADLKTKLALAETHL
jgi:hypothetical protein